MTPIRLLHSAIAPALAELTNVGITDSPDARRFMLAIALQESGLKHRRQVTASGEENGPAAGFWQFEKNGGCRGALTHRVIAPHMRMVCDAYNIEPTAMALWDAIRYQDVVAAAAARLLIYSLPGKMPTTAAAGWVQYLEAWRPGKPHPATWLTCWATATATTGANP